MNRITPEKKSQSQGNWLLSFFYRTFIGRWLLKCVQKCHMDRIVVAFLWSPFSHPLIGWYAKRSCIPLTREERQSFASFRDFFARTRENDPIDMDPNHLISPCDGLISTFSIDENSSFAIKGSRYRLKDLLMDDALASNYHGGICLLFRLRPSDYHHYCYIDDGYQGEHHSIPGILHSVHPIACEQYPVYTLNRRCWSLLSTVHFGPVVQTEIGALIVGGICNEKQNAPFLKGREKGHFELSGSTIALLFEKDRIHLKPELMRQLETADEVPVRLGQWIGNAQKQASKGNIPYRL